MDLFEEELRRLTILIEHGTTGCFAFALYNDPEIPQFITDKLKRKLDLPFHEYYINPINKSPLGILRGKAFDQNKHEIVWFYDIEKGFPETLGYINLGRDELAKYNSSFIFWVSQETFIRIAREAPDFFSRRSGSKFDFSINTRQEFGILGLIDVVNFTSQARELTTKYEQQFLDYYYRESQNIIEAHGFEWIKSIGDAVVFFGDVNKVDDFMSIMLDLFQAKKIKDSFGFKVSLRMVAHCGPFIFWLNKDGKKIDFTGSEAIKMFRLEKEAMEEELIVTDALFACLKSSLSKHHIESFKEGQPKLLKGFDDTPFTIYRLISPKKVEVGEEKSCNLLNLRLQELKERSQKIQVMAGLYEPIDIEKSFINLTIDQERMPLVQGSHKKMRKYHEGWEIVKGKSLLEEFEEKQSIQTTFVAKQIFEGFNKGFIYGLPGAGKTTILRYFVHETAKNPRMMPVFTPCMHLPDFEVWCQGKGYNPEEASHELKPGLEYLLYGFLFPSKEKAPNALSADDRVALMNAEQEMLSAWSRSYLSIYVDGLDEAPVQKRSIIIDIVKTIMASITPKDPKDKKTNCIFLTSRSIERQEYDEGQEPVFHVAPLEMEQLRDLAALFYGGKDSELYLEFEQVIWRQEVVKKVAGTPLTALLLMAYYQAFGKIERRYLMYDLLLKFFLLRVWEEIKYPNRVRSKGLKEFFAAAKKDDFLEKEPEVAAQYDCLSSLSYECLYHSTTEGPLRSIQITTIKGYIMDSIGNENAAEKAKKWFNGFLHEQLLVASGREEYTFVHSTMMEFLAARIIAESLIRPGLQSMEYKPHDLSEIAGQDVKYKLETLPIAAGKDRDTGCEIISQIKQVVADKGLTEPMIALSYRCLCEVEGMEKAELQGLQIKPQRQSTEERIKQNRPKVEWVYQHLAGLALSEDEKVLEEALTHYEQVVSGLSRTTLFKEYLPPKGFFSMLDNPRMTLLKRLMSKDKEMEDELKNWTEQWYQEKYGAPTKFLLRLNTEKYHPDDKNFEYYQALVGHSLRGFFGSPNMKHDAEVWSCVFSPDGQTLLSCSADNTLRLWDRKTGQEICRFSGHTDSVSSCAFSPDGQTLLSGSDDNTLRLWDRKTGQEIARLDLLWRVLDISLKPDKEQKEKWEVVTANTNSTLSLFAFEGKELLQG